uniref:Uncharacterized protein n=1 Tax=candidate division WOR-3 bacterium TaxID=2052148 RepID=A0A7C6A982_UNCW3
MKLNLDIKINPFGGLIDLAAIIKRLLDISEKSIFFKRIIKKSNYVMIKQPDFGKIIFDENRPIDYQPEN